MHAGVTKWQGTRAAKNERWVTDRWMLRTLRGQATGETESALGLPNGVWDTTGLV